MMVLPEVKYSEGKEEDEDQKGGNDSLAHEHKEEIKVILHNSTEPLISSTLNNNLKY